MSKYMHGAIDTLHLLQSVHIYTPRMRAAVNTILRHWLAACVHAQHAGIIQQVRSSVTFRLFEDNTESSGGINIMFSGHQESIVSSKTRSYVAIETHALNYCPDETNLSHTGYACEASGVGA